MSVFSHFFYGKINDAWLVTTIAGMVMLTITIGILCNTVNWK